MRTGPRAYEKDTPIQFPPSSIVAVGTGWRVFGAVAAVATAVWLYYCGQVVRAGHAAFAATSYGTVWGIIVANIVHLIGISHVGIAISAGVRVLRLHQYRNIARLAEFITIVALVTAVANIALDVGRPDRFLTGILRHGSWTAPMVWSMTVICLYLFASAVYLYLSMRRDLWMLSNSRLRLRPLYAVLALGYDDSAETQARHERTLFWLAITLIPIMVSVHSVYGWIFGLLAAKPGWYNPLQAPYFVLGAIVSGFSAVLLVAALLRTSRGWRHSLEERVFKALGAFLAFVVFLYLYFMASEHLTAQYSTLPAEKAVSTSMLVGRFSTSFWLMVVIGLVLPFVVLLVQSLRRSSVNIGMTALAALFINAAMWWKRYLIVVTAQQFPHLPTPRAVNAYVPTHTEVVLTLGSYAFAALLLWVFLRALPAFPTAPLPTVARSEPSPGGRNVRGAVVLATMIVGVAAIVWGVTTRHLAYAPLKWVAGIVLLACIPLEICLIPGATSNEADEAPAV